MRQGPDGGWVGVREDAPGAAGGAQQVRPEAGRGVGEGGPDVSAGSREECLRGLEESVRTASPGEPVTLVVEVLPALAGVAEAAGLLGWDKRRVVTYAARGRFPEPVQALASGRVWLRDDVEAFATAFHGRRRAAAGRDGG
jgi:hypothetical protein